MSTRRVELGELSPEQGIGNGLFVENMDLVKNIKVKVAIQVGGAELTIGELFSLKEKGIIRLDKDVSSPLDILLEGKLVARGTLVAVDDNFGICITEVVNTVAG